MPALDRSGDDAHAVHDPDTNDPDGPDAGDQDDDVARPRFGPRGRRGPLDVLCKILIEELRERCPGLLPEDPLPPGVPAQPLPVEPKQYAQLVGLAARQAAATAALGRVPAIDDDLPGVVVWEEGTAALAVGIAQLDVAVAEGAITVTVPVWCDQLPDGRDTVRVTFAVGTPARPAGLLAATTPQPEGPPVVVRRWAEQLTALAWQAVLDTAAGIAASAGTDPDGTPLVVAALAAADGGLEVLPQARHGFDRVLTGRAVTS